VQLAFSHSFENALKQLMDHAAEIQKRVQVLAKEGVRYELADEAPEVVDGTIEGVVESVFRSINGIASHRINKAKGELESHADFLKGVRGLESVRDMLRSFQGRTVDIMTGVLKQIADGRSALLQEIAGYLAATKEANKGLGLGPQMALEAALFKFQKDLVEGQLDNVVLATGLSETKAVVKASDVELDLTISGMPYKALEVAPVQGMSALLGDALKNAGKEGWVAPEGMDPELAEALRAWAAGGKLSEAAQEKVTYALEQFQAQVRESNARVKAVYKGLFAAVMKAFQDAAQRSIIVLLVRLNGIGNLAVVESAVVEEVSQEALVAAEVADTAAKIDQHVELIDEAVA
ncbi:MAG: hypothetical protein ACTJLL_02445, partial [Anaplasma sp.]